MSSGTGSHRAVSVSVFSAVDTCSRDVPSCASPVAFLPHRWTAASRPRSAASIRLLVEKKNQKGKNELNSTWTMESRMDLKQIWTTCLIRFELETWKWGQLRKRTTRLCSILLFQQSLFFFDFCFLHYSRRTERDIREANQMERAASMGRQNGNERKHSRRFFGAKTMLVGALFRIVGRRRRLGSEEKEFLPRWEQWRLNKKRKEKNIRKLRSLGLEIAATQYVAVFLVLCVCALLLPHFVSIL